MLMVLFAAAIAGIGGFVIFQFSRYGFVSPAAAMCRLLAVLPSQVADRLPAPSFGTLERLVVGEIARTRVTSTGDAVSIPRRFEVALSEQSWETVKCSPGFFLSDTAIAAEELAEKRGWVTDGDLALCWIIRANVSTNHPRVVPIGLASTPEGEALERQIATGSPLSHCEPRATVDLWHSKNLRSDRKRRVPEGQRGRALVLEPVEPKLPTISMPPHVKKLLIGRDENSDVVIDRREISRRQCGIQRVGGEFVVTDLDSTNGTKVNGKSVGRQAMILETGDVLELAKTVSYKRS